MLLVVLHGQNLTEWFWFTLWLVSHLKRKEIQRYYFTNNVTKLHTSHLQPFAGTPGTVEPSQLSSEARAAPLAVVLLVTELI